jgi:hypothetical protein
MFWKSDLPEDMSALIKTLRLEALAARGREAGDDDEDGGEVWDENAEVIAIGCDETDDDDLGEQ